MARTSWALLLLGVFSVMQGLNALVIDPPCRPAKECPAVCRIFCGYGNVLDVYGCPTCWCRDPPTPECPRQKCFPCPNGYIYENGCQTCRCKPVCKPAVCPTIKCAYGLKRDANGCEICGCNPKPVYPFLKCPAINCPNGRLEVNGCPTCECKPDELSPKSESQIPVCPRIACTNKVCPNGYIIRNGCRTCECKPDVCQDRCPHYCANPAVYALPSGCNCRCLRLPPIY